jgi:Fe-S-cluster-containing dehydrogenase component
MRFSEYENDKGDLEWLIRKDGCMHCEDPGCLKACPSPLELNLVLCAAQLISTM